LKFYITILAILLIAAGNMVTRLSIASMHAQVRMQILLFREYCKNHATKIEPKVELFPESGEKL
jgi:hypothetical protein